MESVSFLLKNRSRRERKELIQFTDALSLHLQAGFDLAYSWPKTLEGLAHDLSAATRERLAPKEAGMSELLGKLAQSYPAPRHRVWFAAICDLYSSGAALNQAVSAMADSLRKEQEIDLEAHCRILPTKINILLLLFFLPPAFLLLFAPLMLEILGAFAGWLR